MYLKAFMYKQNLRKLSIFNVIHKASYCSTVPIFNNLNINCKRSNFKSKPLKISKMFEKCANFVKKNKTNYDSLIFAKKRKLGQLGFLLDNRYCVRRKYDEKVGAQKDTNIKPKAQYRHFKKYYRVQVNQNEPKKELKELCGMQILMPITPVNKIDSVDFEYVGDQDIFYSESISPSEQAQSIYSIYDFKFQQFTEEITDFIA